MAKGDKIKIVYAVGDTTGAVEVSASQNGRTLEVEQDKIKLEIVEKTRGGTTVRRVWLPISAVLFIDDQRRGEE